MNFKNLFLGLLLLSTLASCGSKSSNRTPVDNTQTFEQSEELRSAVADQYVVCGEDGLACPGFSAKLVYWGQESDTEYYMGVCSGSLYNGKYIITNSHCIPADIKTAGAKCDKNMKVLFPKTSRFDEESAGCSQVIQVFNEDINPDIAVIELDRVVNRQSVQIATSGFVDNTLVHAFVMDPSKSDRSLGTIKHKSCTLSVDNAYTLSTSTTSSSAVLYGNNCNVISGNSGTGLLNSNAELIGAVFAKIEKDKLEDFFIKSRIKYSAFTYMGIAQNITCIRDITSSAGVGCNMAQPTKSDLASYVNRALNQHGLSSVDKSQIEYKVGPGFKLELTKVARAESSSSLESFEANWLKSFVGGSSASKLEHISKGLLSR